MIKGMLQLVSQELNDFLTHHNGSKIVVVENVKYANDDSAPPSNIEVSNKVVVSVVGVEEEPLSKNAPHKIKVGTQQFSANPPIQVYLYVLFAVNRESYLDSLDQLSGIIRFFQGKKRFTLSNTPNPDGLSIEGDFEVTFMLHTPDFNEANNMWSMLGGKMLPYVLYKVRMIELSREQAQQTLTPITTIITQ